MQIRKPAQVHDVVVIGSGAAGGMAAWNLTRQGVNVLMLDAGTRWRRSQFWSHVKPWEAPQRIAAGQQPPRFYVDLKTAPYDTPPGRPFDLVRVWGRGGKTNVWGRVSLRYSDLDFTQAERDGWEIPWPIRYRDLAPYYDKVDQLIGVCGGDDDLDSLPGSRFHLPPPAPRCGERLLQKAAGNLGIQVVSGRRAVLTRPHNGHAACHYCGACGKGCDVAAFFNSTDYLTEPALATGRLRIVDNAVVARVTVDDKGRANGVQYFDRETGQERQVRARVVVMAASCIDSTRILLNSKSQRHPNGIGNGSDTVGRYLSEQVRLHMFGFVPELLGAPVQNDDGIGGEHVYLPRFNHRDGRKRDYLRGFGMQFWGCGAGDNAGFAKALPGFGADFKAAVKRRYPALVAMHPYGEVLPYADNRITVDESRLDRFGVPIAKIDFHYRENERKMMREMYETAAAIMKAAKAEVLPYDPEFMGMPGQAIHEHSTCRMSADPKRGPLNGFCQMHEVKNVFVVDGAAFTTASEKNPTLTILALAWRASDYLAAELKATRL